MEAWWLLFIGLTDLFWYLVGYSGSSELDDWIFETSSLWQCSMMLTAIFFWGVKENVQPIRDFRGEWRSSRMWIPSYSWDHSVPIVLVFCTSALHAWQIFLWSFCPLLSFIESLPRKGQHTHLSCREFPPGLLSPLIFLADLGKGHLLIRFETIKVTSASLQITWKVYSIVPKCCLQNPRARRVHPVFIMYLQSSLGWLTLIGDLSTPLNSAWLIHILLNFAL